MPDGALAGVFVVMAAGITMGAGGFPIKLMKSYRFEHWFLVGSTLGTCVIPWLVTFCFCPHWKAALGDLWAHHRYELALSNLFSIGQGVANLLCCVCFVRIGFALTNGILTGLGASIGVVIPMIFKGSGLFRKAPDVLTPAGVTVLAGVAVMLCGVAFATRAGFGREHALVQQNRKPTGFAGGLVMAAAAGIISCSISFSFVYSQGPIIGAMTAHGASSVAATFSVWAIGLMGATIVGAIYTAVLISRAQSWPVLWSSGTDLLWTLLLGINSAAAVFLLGKGMLMLGALGASVGFGVQQAMQMSGSQAVGFISGEWRGIHGTPRRFMFTSIACLLAASVVMAYGNALVR